MLALLGYRRRHGALIAFHMGDHLLDRDAIGIAAGNEARIFAPHHVDQLRVLQPAQHAQHLRVGGCELLGQAVRRRGILALLEAARDLDQSAQGEVEIVAGLVFDALLGGAQQSVQILVDVADLHAQQQDDPHDLDGDQEDQGQADRAVNQVELPGEKMPGVNAEPPAHQREQRGGHHRPHDGSFELHVRRRHQPEQHGEGDEHHHHRDDLEDEVVLEQDAEVAVLLENVGTGEGDAHQHRSPEEQHGESHDLLAIAADAAHFPDLIDGGLHGQEQPEGDDDEDDHAEGGGGLGALRELC